MSNWLYCDNAGCKRHAQYLCKSCGKLVCSRHGTSVAEEEEEQYCLICAVQVGLSGAQHELFQSVRPRAKKRALDGLNKGV